VPLRGVVLALVGDDAVLAVVCVLAVVSLSVLEALIDTEQIKTNIVAGTSHLSSSCLL